MISLNSSMEPRLPRASRPTACSRQCSILFEGRMDAVIDGREYVATAGNLIRLPMNIPHGLFNKSEQPIDDSPGWSGCVVHSLRPGRFTS